MSSVPNALACLLIAPFNPSLLLQAPSSSGNRVESALRAAARGAGREEVTGSSDAEWLAGRLQEALIGVGTSLSNRSDAEDA